MANYVYPAIALIGGGTGALDAIDGTALADKDMAMVSVQGDKTYFYVLNATSGAAEASPGIIAPDANGGDKRWILTGFTPVPAATGFTIAGGTTSKTLTVEDTSLVNQDLTTDASPTFATVKLSGLTDLKIPKHVGDATGLADTTITVSANNEVTNASQPAFLAKPSADVLNQTGDGTTYTIIFNTEIFDQGGDYDTSTGIFTAPVTGKYNLSFCIDAYSGTADHANWQSFLVSSNRSYGHVIITGAGANPFTSYSPSLSVLADMDAADTVYLTFRVTGGTKVVDFDTGSFFSGHLVC